VTAEQDVRRQDEGILDEIYEERRRQEEIWGEQNHPNGTGGAFFEAMRDHMRERCQIAAKVGKVTWEHVVQEEHFEALAEEGDERLCAPSSSRKSPSS
jgi:hypothetical protein